MKAAANWQQSNSISAHSVINNAQMRFNLAWHHAHKAPLLLLLSGDTHHAPAYITAMDMDTGNMDVTAVAPFVQYADGPRDYQVTGHHQGGGDFVASGLCRFTANSSVLHMTMPHSAALCERQELPHRVAPPGSTLHFFVTGTPTLEAMCQVLSMSLDGLSVTWASALGMPRLPLGRLIEDAVLHCSGEVLQMGPMRVVHVGVEQHGHVIGFSFTNHTLHEPLQHRTVLGGTRHTS